jgi:hypothetical protein
LFPFAEVLSILIEDLDAHVTAVGDKESSLGVQGEVVRSSEFSRPRSEFVEGLDELAVLGEPGDARDGRALRILLCPSEIKTSPFGAMTILVGCVNASGGLQPLPVCRASIAPCHRGRTDDDVPLFFAGEFASSRSFAER